MNVAAVDVSESIGYLDSSYRYKENVFHILKTLEPPVSVIRWNSEAKLIEYSKIVPEMGEFEASKGTVPFTFI